MESNTFFKDCKRHTASKNLFQKLSMIIITQNVKIQHWRPSVNIIYSEKMRK
jgi:hypothetical protein